MKYFGVNLEFDHHLVDSIIKAAIIHNIPGYVCSVDANVLANAAKDENYQQIVNNSLVNICDGKSISLLATVLNLQVLRANVGADFFLNYITNKNYKYFFLGNTQDVLDCLRKNLIKINPRIETMKFVTLPFLRVEDFDYQTIADTINQDMPDIVWVSLGAPKQEIFMSKLQPYLSRGVMFGFGAIFDFNAGVNGIKRAPPIMLKFNSEWIYRLVKQPKKQWPRIVHILKMYPRLVSAEIKKKLISGNK